MYKRQIYILRAAKEEIAMVQLIVGEKGKGKTKILLDKVNTAVSYTHLDVYKRQELEKTVYGVFQQQQEKVFQQIKEELTKEKPVAYKDLSKDCLLYTSHCGQRTCRTFLCLLSGTSRFKAFDY